MQNCLYGSLNPFGSILYQPGSVADWLNNASWVIGALWYFHSSRKFPYSPHRANNSPGAPPADNQRSGSGSRLCEVHWHQGMNFKTLNLFTQRKASVWRRSACQSESHLTVFEEQHVYYVSLMRQRKMSDNCAHALTSICFHTLMCKISTFRNTKEKVKYWRWKMAKTIFVLVFLTVAWHVVSQ